MKKIFGIIALGVFMTSFAFGQENVKVEFSIEGLSCGGCANTAKGVLEDLKGVISADVNFNTKTAIVYTDGTVTEKEIKEAIAAKNFQALFANDNVVKPLSKEEKKGLDIKTITGGKKISFEDHLSSGKLTVFDFFAEWCGPCKIYSPKVERLLLEYDNVAVRKVDVVEWKSDLAKQLTREYKLPALPFTLIFDDKGNLVGRIEGNNIEEVKKILSAK
ncbi:MAG: cation transporter [Candidatus Cyclobacteriaceae bacterium M2_1C_046]